MLELIEREISKTYSLAADLSKTTGYTHSDTKSLKNHMSDMVQQVEMVTPDSTSFAYYYHMPPNIWHLHMQVAISSGALRKYSTIELDKDSISVSTVQKQIDSIFESYGRCSLSNPCDLDLGTK